MNKFLIRRERNFITITDTSGKISKPILISITHPANSEECFVAASNIVNQIKDTTESELKNLTVFFYLWPVKFIEYSQHFLLVEASTKGTLSGLISHYKDKLAEFRYLKVKPQYTNEKQLVTVSKDVLHGAVMEGIRNIEKENHSGWLIVHKGWSEDEELLEIPFGEFILAIEKKTALYESDYMNFFLPYGYKFYLSKGHWKHMKYTFTK